MHHQSRTRAFGSGIADLNGNGARRGFQYEAEPDDADDEPPPSEEPAEPDGPMSDADPTGDDEPPAWSTADGDTLVLPVPVWMRWGGGYRPRWPWGPRRPRPRRRPPPAIERLGRLATGARRIGTLRHRRSGARLPVYRGRLGRRSYRIVARPRGGLRREIVLIRPDSVHGEMEIFPLSAATRREHRDAATTGDGWQLRLPHARVHTILSRLQPEQVRRLAGNSMGADPGPAVARSIRRLASEARRVGSFGPGGRMPVFAVAGYRILVHPIAEQEGEILTLRPPDSAEREAEITLPIARRLSGRQKDQLRRAARTAFFQAHPRQRGKPIEVHHRVPLEWSHLLPGAHPNRLSNLQGLASRDHLRKASDLWTAFRNAYQYRRRQPTGRDVLHFAGLVDRSLNLPYPL